MILHPVSQQLIDQYVATPAQSVLITGDSGIGFSGAYDTIAAQFKTIPYIVHPTDGTISAETIRSLYDLTRGRSVASRLIIIDDADKMSLTAQNAFLKLLEEPSASIYFILASHTPSLLLPTIHSRLAMFRLHPISPEQSQALLDTLGVKDAKKRQQLLFIAEGLPALLTTLANDEDLFTARAQIVRDARTFVQANRYEKFKIANSYKDRTTALRMITDAARLLRQSTAQGNASTVIKELNKLMTSYERIEANGNIRLWLTMAVV